MATPALIGCLPVVSPAAPAANTLIDGFGRRHNNLRISVTDRCNLRCTYCMPEHARFLPSEQLLTFDEIVRIVEVGVSLGIDKIRLTGGEPLMRPNLPELITRLAAMSKIRDLALTTNGVFLAKQAAELRRAGLQRINISLDTLDGDEFRQITRRDALEQVLAGIQAAQDAGFANIKLNAVPLRGIADQQLIRLARFAREQSLELRFIEFMPLEADEVWQPATVLTGREIRAILADAGLPTEPIPVEDPSAPATEFAYTDGIGRLGIIASVSEPFCERCNRLRLTAEGKLRHCLFALEEIDLRTLLRNGGSNEALIAAFQACVASKWAGHQINGIGFQRPARTMHTIGG